jgi:hypothetical protein
MIVNSTRIPGIEIVPPSLPIEIEEHYELMPQGRFLNGSKRMRQIKRRPEGLLVSNYFVIN